MLSRFTSKCAKHYAPNWFNCLIVCPLWAKSDKYYSRKACEIYAVMKRKDSNRVEILSDHGEAESTSNLSGYTILLYSVGCEYNHNLGEFSTRFL